MEAIRNYYQQLMDNEPIAAVILQLCGIVAILLVISRLGLWFIISCFNKWREKVEKQENSAEHIAQIDNMQKVIKKIWGYAVLFMAIPVTVWVFNISLKSFYNFENSIFAIPLLGTVIKLTLVIVMTYLGLRIGNLGIKAAFERQRKEQVKENAKRVFPKVAVKESKLRTLETISLSFYRYTIYFIALLSILTIFDVSPSTVVTSAGVLGVAIGFGAQNLVKDVITGAFIMFEDQFDVGDYIEICGISGIVDDIGLRSTRIKSFDGSLHYVPNGEISIVSNLSRDYRRSIVDIGVGYGENLARVEEILKDLCVSIELNNPWIVEGPSVLGVQELGKYDITFRIVAYTEPMEQWRAERLLRLAVKNRLDEEGIEIPYPHQVIISNETGEKND